MTTVLVVLNGRQSAPDLLTDLDAAGIEVVCVLADKSKLIALTARHGPDLVVFDDALPSEALFAQTQSIADTVPRPVVVFTGDTDATHIQQATQSGVHAYVVNGYAAGRLRPLIHLAQARFKQEQAMAAALADVTARLEERKVVDRAKGILMRSRALSDDDAFKLLRAASMHSNQRLGQVSQQIIQSAHFAEAVNRAGQLRMLSQRLVKLYLLHVLGGDAQPCAAQFNESSHRIDDNLALLGKSLSAPTYGDLLAHIAVTWRQLKQIMQGPLEAQQTEPMDVLAEQMLQGAERLTASLENAGAAAPLHVINVAGRQRMLCQRFAKQALIAALEQGRTRQTNMDGMAATQVAFEQGLSYLNGIPLSTPSIRATLDAAALHWTQTLAGAARAKHTSGQGQLAQASEALLEVFESLTTQYEHSMQMLVG